MSQLLLTQHRVSSIGSAAWGQQHGRRLTAAAMLTCLPIDIFYFDAAPLGGVIRRFFYTHRLISGIVIYWKTDGVSCRSIEYFEDDHGVIEGDGIEESN